MKYIEEIITSYTEKIDYEEFGLVSYFQLYKGTNVILSQLESKL